MSPIPRSGFPLLLGLIALFAPPGAGRLHAAGAATYRLPVRSGWNLLALPVTVADGTKDSLFPSSASSAFIYDGAYRGVAALAEGSGFWLKFPGDDTVTIAGYGHFRDTIPVRAGWNLVGGLTAPTAVGRIVTVPEGNLDSRYFAYAPPGGYVAADTLQPGLGYMVKMRQAGSLVITAMNVPCPGVGPFEYGGVTYHGVQIVDQCWMRENLNLGGMVFGGLDQADDGAVEKYCWIDDEINCTKYGGLYQWNEAMAYSAVPGSRGICPPGWHVPTLAEFRALDTVTGGNANHLKELREGMNDGSGTNLTGFSAVLSGYRHGDGSFSIFGYQTYYWTSTPVPPANAPALYLFYNYGDYFFYNLGREYGVNVRCLKD